MHGVGLQLDYQTITAIANDPQRDVGITRQFYSYPAKFQYRLPAYLIQTLSSPNDIVLDPYCGGGTTPLEAGLLHRKGIAYDLNPLAALIATVKTTPISKARLTCTADALRRAGVSMSPTTLFDEDDITCLGLDVAVDIASIAAAIWAIQDQAERAFFSLALIHTVKIIGRRDYDSVSLSMSRELDLFDGLSPARVSFSMFFRKVAEMADQLQSLPPDFVQPQIYNQSNHDMSDVRKSSVALVVTSPPYKDLDVEYGLLRIQRPSQGRSKRTQFVARFLQCEQFPEKGRLCGDRGDAYWDNLRATLSEVVRVLQPGRLAFFWTGFKTDDDRKRFGEECASAGLPVTRFIAVQLGNDRVASSRSTHHERDTGMLNKDYLIVTESR